MMIAHDRDREAVWRASVERPARDVVPRRP